MYMTKIKTLVAFPFLARLSPLFRLCCCISIRSRHYSTKWSQNATIGVFGQKNATRRNVFWRWKIMFSHNFFNYHYDWKSDAFCKSNDRDAFLWCSRVSSFFFQRIKSFDYCRQCHRRPRESLYVNDGVLAVSCSSWEQYCRKPSYVRGWEIIGNTHTQPMATFRLLHTGQNASRGYFTLGNLCFWVDVQYARLGRNWDHPGIYNRACPWLG